MNLSKAINLFLEHCYRRRLSSHTLRAYTKDLTSFQMQLNSDIPIENIDKPRLIHWIDVLQKQYSPRSAKRKLAVIKSLFTWLLLEDHIEFNPFTKIRCDIQQPKTLPKNIPQDRLKLIFESIKYLSKNSDNSPFQMHNLVTMELALTLLISTGIRVSELCHIEISDIDLYSSTIRVKGKGNKERNVFISGNGILNCIQKYIKHKESINTIEEQLLITFAGKPTTPAFIRYHLKKIIKTNNINERMTPHMFRHTTATSLLDRGVDIRHVQKLLGHSSINTTVIYTHVSDAGLKNAICSVGLEDIAGFN